MVAPLLIVTPLAITLSILNRLLGFEGIRVGRIRVKGQAALDR
jgi:hypothetical protein